jgi:hypothetical protein
VKMAAVMIDPGLGAQKIINILYRSNDDTNKLR